MAFFFAAPVVAPGILSSLGLASGAAASAPAFFFTASTAGASASSAAAAYAAAMAAAGYPVGAATSMAAAYATTAASCSAGASTMAAAYGAAAAAVGGAAAASSAASSAAVGAYAAVASMMGIGAAAAAPAAVVSTSTVVMAAVATAGVAGVAGVALASNSDGSADKGSSDIPVASARAEDNANSRTSSTSAPAHPSSGENPPGLVKPAASVSTSNPLPEQIEPPKSPGDDENSSSRTSRTTKVVCGVVIGAAVGVVAYAMMPAAAPASALLSYTPACAEPVLVAIGDLGSFVWAPASGAGGGLGASWVFASFIKAIGFHKIGISAGSIAAKMMSWSAIANGGGVASGSLVAVLQSIGAAGLGLCMLGLFVGFGMIGGTAYLYFYGGTVAKASAASSTWTTFLTSFGATGLVCVVVIAATGCVYKRYFRDGMPFAAGEV